MNSYKLAAATMICKALKHEYGIDATPVEIAWTLRDNKDRQQGDFALPCHRWAKQLNTCPNEIAATLMNNINKQIQEENQ